MHSISSIKDQHERPPAWSELPHGIPTLEKLESKDSSVAKLVVLDDMQEMTDKKKSFEDLIKAIHSSQPPLQHAHHFHSTGHLPEHAHGQAGQAGREHHRHEQLHTTCPS